MSKKKGSSIKLRTLSVSEYERVKSALENKKYKFRTLRGVSHSAGVSIEVARRVIKSHPEEMVVLARKNQDGELLYTTRDHYKNKASIAEKLVGVLINRVY